MERTFGTLALTLLFREMQELIEAGYVYIAKPPLYKLKQGSRERVHREGLRLEDILLSDKWEKLNVFDRHGTQFKLTDTRWQRFVRLLGAVRRLVLDAACRARARDGAVPGGVLVAGRAGHERRCRDRAVVPRRSGGRDSCHRAGRARSAGAAREGDGDPYRLCSSPTASSAACSTRRSIASSPLCTSS